jgi:hypothetical protein
VRSFGGGFCGGWGVGIKQEARRREKASVRRRERGGVVMAKPPEEGERGSGGRRVVLSLRGLGPCDGACGCGRDFRC